MSPSKALEIAEVNDEPNFRQISVKASSNELKGFIGGESKNIEKNFDESLSRSKQEYINDDYLSIIPEGLPSEKAAVGRIDLRWDIINYYPAKIVEINKSFVFLDCVVDRESTKIELWKFPKEIIGDSCELKEGNIILITYLQRPGKITYIFQDANNLHYDHYFNLEDDFSEKWAGQRLR